MLYKIQQIKMDLNHTPEQLEKRVAQELKIKLEEISQYSIIKKSWDARKKQDIKVVYSVEVECKIPLKNNAGNNNIIMLTKKPRYQFPQSKTKIKLRPVIIGSGPAGLLCALMLAENGYNPIVLERGQDVDNRLRDVHTLFETGILNENSNIQFGEGGAGTYSDGKLNTQVKDPLLRKEKVLETFVEAGAPNEILYLNKPHIGTDYLITVVKNIRMKIENLGGEVRFDSQVTSLLIENSRINGVIINGDEELLTNHVVLAIGHSARDTFETLHNLSVDMEQKAFAIGVRIEHPQSMISESQFGKDFNHPNLPVADYKLTYRSSEGRGVYTFCMCPGGFVVNSSSEKLGVVCNGMSYFKRDAKNANSAILVNVNPEDFGSQDVLAGVEFQRKWERKAYEIAGSNYHLPVQLLKDFLANRKSERFGDVMPSLKGKQQFANLNDCLPDYVAKGIKEAVADFDHKIRGFAREDALLTGVETRSSSPVRILRNEDYESNIKGLYPCGEGAGYAGGIMSAAMDGIKVAEKIVQ